MWKIIVLCLFTIALVYFSRRSLQVLHSHGFYRFFAWESIFGLFLLNINHWFRSPGSWYQLISWFLLITSILPLVLGVKLLTSRGKPTTQRKGEPELLAFEKTTALVTSGIYHYIRHPLYSSLLFLAWGVFFKDPSLPGGLLVLAATSFLIATAKADEAECIRFFGTPYQDYMKRTKRFVPFLL
jgi:protein-S-isoprenylcysteine O-methyltransferase Ste14